MRLSAQPENHPIESNEACDRGLGASVGRNALRFIARYKLLARAANAAATPGGPALHAGVARSH